MILYLSLIAISFIQHTESATFSDATSLHTTLTTGYNKNVRPKTNQDEPTDLYLSITLKSITSLDEVNGVLTTVSATTIQWVDDNLPWAPSSHGNIYGIKMEESLIWVPQILISNPAKKVEKLGLPSTEATVYYSGHVVYSFGEMLLSTCDVDVTYFPFDTQDCVIELMPFGYSTSDINLISLPVDQGIFSENNVWVLKSTSSDTAYFGNQPYTKITLSLERRYTFFILNLYSPVLILAFLNAMVFVLPADSGERVGYAITCLLSLSVYMTFASENLPTSSKPIAVIIYVLLLYMLISTLICLGTILGLRLHRHDGDNPPPLCLAKICCLTNIRCRKSKVGQSVDSEEMEDILTERTATWGDVASIFDRLCFIASVLCIVLLSVVYLLIVRKVI